MAYIVETTTLQEIKDAAPETIWTSVLTCWWTHRATDLRTLPNGLPCDPRGGVLMMDDGQSFLTRAEANPDHYGKHGLAAFIASHNDNCVVSCDDTRNTCLRSWQEYNDLLDHQRPGIVDAMAFEIHGAAGTMVKRDTYPMPEDGWVCFHCGERFTTVGTAEDHFGARPSDMAACLIKVGEERGLVMELRRVQAELREIKDNVCAVCSQKMANKQALADHKWLRHKVR